MIKSKRLVISTSLGLVAGILCCIGGKLLGEEFNTLTVLMVLFHRILLGIVIGISGLQLPWAFHGLIIGFIVGLPVYPLIVQDGGLISYSVMGIVWGFFIELFTTVVFKAKAQLE